MFAKRFFYVCAGLLCLVFTYHLGATRATALSLGTPMTGLYFDIVGAPGGNVRSGGTIYYPTGPTYGGWGQITNLPPVPVESLVWLDMPRGSNVPYWAITQDGNGWYNAGGNTWVDMGLVPGGATPTQSMTYGELKVRYRGQAQRDANNPADFGTRPNTRER